MGMKDEMRNLGYSKEDEYFFKKDQELIAKMRAAANEKKKEMEAAHKGKPYWMRCPKCGGELREENFKDTVRLDRCSGCNGIFLDRGELELVLSTGVGALKPRS